MKNCLRGPDGHGTVVEFDAANRVSSVTRTEPAGATIMQAAYTYFANGLVDRVVYANGLGAGVKYTYDATNRVTVIHHKDILGGTILKLVYSYTTNDLVASLAEVDSSGFTTTTTFSYDARGRLIREVRDDSLGTTDYDWTYEYDAGGNRLLKHEGPTVANTLHRFEERYEYDVNGNELKYGTANNRLMKIERWKIDTDLVKKRCREELFGRVSVRS